MRIALATPGTGGLPTGNQTTARRWAAIWRRLGHHVAAAGADGGSRAPDVLVALHARKSASAVWGFRRAWPGRPVIVALTGTDIYPRLTPAARRVVAAADRLVVLQALATAALPAEARGKARVIYQSALAGAGPARGTRGLLGQEFTVMVAANLRGVKDPLRAALASRGLPPMRQVRVIHAGAALSPAWEARARAEMRRNARYRWLGPLTPRQTRRRLAAAHVLVVSSRREGGPNVISEAIADGTPVLATRVDGNVGLLGRDYAGYFEPGGTAALTRLIRRAEDEPRFLARLRRQVRARRRLFTPQRERAAWRRLLAEIKAR